MFVELEYVSAYHHSEPAGRTSYCNLLGPAGPFQIYKMKRPSQETIIWRVI